MHQIKLGRSPDRASHRHVLGKTAAGLAAGAMLASLMSVPASATLSATGPVNPAHGYPQWFTDSNGLQLELCLDGPMCLATAERPNPAAPVSFPDNFPGEAFWWAGEAHIESGSTTALLVLAQEAAFGGAAEEIVNGEQVAFSRVRIRIEGLQDGGSYTITHPYGSIVLPAEAEVAGGAGVINYTEDIGCFDIPCSEADFARAATGTVGPFLRWASGAPAGYIGDPAVDHTVIGSPTGNNLFRVAGPGLATPLETNLFSIQGKVAGPFFDVASTHPFVAGITYAKNQGITTGYPDGTFQPFGSTQRAAMAAFLYRSQGSPAYTPPAVSPFTDVPTNHPFYKEIMWIKDRGITTGMTATTFAPAAPVNRKDMAAFLYRLAGQPAFTAPGVSPFADMTPTSQFYKEVTWLHSEGITTGYPDGYHPLEDVQRQASVTFLYRMAGSPAV